MWFHVRAIKDVHQEKYSIDAIFHFDTELLCDQFLTANKILSITTESYTAPAESFGDISGMIHWQWQNIDFVMAGMDLQTTVRTLCYMWLELYAINSFHRPLDPQEALTVIKQISQEVQAHIVDKESQIQSQIHDAKAVYTDVAADKIQTYITRVLQDAEYALQKYSHHTTLVRTLQDHISDLKKMRMSNNADKLEDIIHKLYGTIDAMEEDYLAQLPKETIGQNSIVWLSFFVRLYNKWERAKKLYQIGIHLRNDELLYARAWYVIVTTKFLWQDGWELLAQWRQHPRAVISLLHMSIALAIVVIILVSLVTAFPLFATIDQSLWYALLSLGLLAISFQLSLLLHKRYGWQSSAMLLISALVFVCLHYISRWFLILS